MSVRSTCFDSSTKYFEVQASPDDADDDCDLTPIEETAESALRDLDRDAGARSAISSFFMAAHTESTVDPALIGRGSNANPFVAQSGGPSDLKHWKAAAAIFEQRLAATKAKGQSERRAVAHLKKAETARRRVIAERERSAQRRAAAAALKADPTARALVRSAHLKAATANARGDRFLEKIVGREKSLSMFWRAMLDAKAKHGSKCSDRRIASEYTILTGELMDKRRATSHRNIVNKLEAPGGAWARLK
ncbi:hypothetical protein [Tardiphaga sp.]|uniref:hypothetical protein n=1 Tax=Tardiphaga sp. TaxID=1926292 RepID=UPI00262C8B2C|nr:hypothetical protein [Tardiphaga sp.]MDB5616173.1 hypothetical protein [Tardiphaga sp.]